jgi:hypothetical protein
MRVSFAASSISNTGAMYLTGLRREKAAISSECSFHQQPFQQAVNIARRQLSVAK